MSDLKGGNPAVRISKAHATLVGEIQGPPTLANVQSKNVTDKERAAEIASGKGSSL